MVWQVWQCSVGLSIFGKLQKSHLVTILYLLTAPPTFYCPYQKHYKLDRRRTILSVNQGHEPLVFLITIAEITTHAGS